MKPVNTVCYLCKGTGHRALSKPYKDCLSAIKALGNPTIQELHKRSGNGFALTATDKRVWRLAAAGYVRILPGRPKRVEIVKR